MRNLPRLSERLYGKPWLSTKDHFQQLHMLLEKVKLDSPMDMPEMPDDNESDCPEMVIDRGLAMLPIYGSIGSNLSAFEKTCLECCDIRDINKWLNQAASDPSVESILLDINSPGGEVTFVPQSADLIYQINKTKPCVAYCNDVMCSAAYWLASACGEVYAHPASCAIGSIGVYSAYLDVSSAFNQAGMRWDIFSAGKYKTEGMEGTSLSPDYKKLLQDDVDGIYSNFTAFIKKCRPKTSIDDMNGLSYDADTALKKGLVDGLVEDISTIFTQ